ncbi:hypothetical protein VKT23_013973 [Stygiomarasmius scandens]|uniref:Crinkler effector protein N-terminal domain-containing protein n=1 Tax=Marasmiellus scandens TaxID=2682957 RepID=A0ABR1J488_9AGAR
MDSASQKRRRPRSPSVINLTLFCCFVGSSTPFVVDISSSLTVDHLKKTIKEKKSDELKGLSARKLQLFKVYIPDEDDLAQKVEDAAEGIKPLNPTMELTEIFPDEPPEETIHIAVKLPDDAGEWFGLSPVIRVSLLICNPGVPSEFRPSQPAYKDPLLQTVKPGTVHSSLQHLYKLAWNDKDRKSLIRLEDSDLDFQYESLIPTAGFDEMSMGLRVLITPEYKAALSDAKCWFSGGEIPPIIREDKEGGDEEGEETGREETRREKTGREETRREKTTRGDNKREDKGEDSYLFVAGMDDVEMGPCEEKVAWSINHPNRKFFIVVGTPGVAVIGKSLFLYYILVERLLARLPTCFQTVPAFFSYWCEEGVFRIPLPVGEEGVEIRDAIPTNAWFLVDSNDSLPTPGAMLKRVNACVVQAASPRVEHLQWTEKASASHYHWFIKPSSLKESLKIKSLHHTEATDEQWKKFFEEYGPSTRLLVSYAHRPNIFNIELRSKISRLSLEQLWDLLFRTPVGSVTRGEVSHWICGINPSFHRYRPYSTFHTPTILRMVKEEYMNRESVLCLRK